MWMRWGSAALVLVLVVGLVLLIRDSAEPPPLPPGMGAAAYEELFEKQAGVRVECRELTRLALAEVRVVEARMNALAEAIEPGRGWREVFGRLRGEHPGRPHNVVEAYRREVKKAVAFVQEKDLVSLPEARLEVLETPDVLPKENYPLAAYLGYKLVVTTSLSSWPWRAKKHLRNHCNVCIPPLVVHEAVPGHHVSFLHTRQREGERAPSFPSPEVAALAQAHFKNKFFYEGWAQYGELLMLQNGYYGDSEGELGAWRMLLLRAVRAWMDPLLHSGEMTPRDAAEYLENRLLLGREAARAEVRRHLVEPVMKTSYYFGMLQILQLRQTLEQRAPGFCQREFHDRLLMWPLPIPKIAQVHFDVELERLPRVSAVEAVGP